MHLAAHSHRSPFPKAEGHADAAGPLVDEDPALQHEDSWQQEVGMIPILSCSGEYYLVILNISIFPKNLVMVVIDSESGRFFFAARYIQRCRDTAFDSSEAVMHIPYERSWLD